MKELPEGTIKTKKILLDQTATLVQILIYMQPTLLVASMITTTRILVEQVALVTQMIQTLVTLKMIRTV